MPVSEAKKKANAKWNASKDNIMVRPTKEEGAVIRTAAASASQSNQQYILQAVRERMARDGFLDQALNVTPIEGPLRPSVTPPLPQGIILPSEALKAAQAAIRNTGEGLEEFVSRAVKEQTARDKISWRMGVNPAIGDKLKGEA